MRYGIFSTRRSVSGSGDFCRLQWLRLEVQRERATSHQYRLSILQHIARQCPSVYDVRDRSVTLEVLKLYPTTSGRRVHTRMAFAARQ